MKRREAEAERESCDEELSSKWWAGARYDSVEDRRGCISGDADLCNVELGKATILFLHGLWTSTDLETERAGGLG